jgi:hypothetical protein
MAKSIVRRHPRKTHLRRGRMVRSANIRYHTRNRPLRRSRYDKTGEYEPDTIKRAVNRINSPESARYVQEDLQKQLHSTQNYIDYLREQGKKSKEQHERAQSKEFGREINEEMKKAKELRSGLNEAFYKGTTLGQSPVIIKIPEPGKSFSGMADKSEFDHNTELKKIGKKWDVLGEKLMGGRAKTPSGGVLVADTTREAEPEGENNISYTFEMNSKPASGGVTLAPFVPSENTVDWSVGSKQNANESKKSLELVNKQRVQLGLPRID